MSQLQSSSLSSDGFVRKAAGLASSNLSLTSSKSKAAAGLDTPLIGIPISRYGTTHAACETALMIEAANIAESKGLIDKAIAEYWRNPWHEKGVLDKQWPEDIIAKYNKENGIVPEKIMSLKRAQEIQRKKDRELKKQVDDFLAGRIDEDGNPIWRNKESEDDVDSEDSEDSEMEDQESLEEEEEMEDYEQEHVNGGTVGLDEATSKDVNMEDIPSNQVSDYLSVINPAEGRPTNTKPRAKPQGSLEHALEDSDMENADPALVPQNTKKPAKKQTKEKHKKDVLEKVQNSKVTKKTSTTKKPSTTKKASTSARKDAVIAHLNTATVKKEAFNSKDGTTTATAQPSTSKASKASKKPTTITASKKPSTSKTTTKTSSTKVSKLSSRPKAISSSAAPSSTVPTAASSGLTPLPGLPTYEGYHYYQLSALCHERNIVSGGNTAELRKRLIQDDINVVNNLPREAKPYHKDTKRARVHQPPVVPGAPQARPAVSVRG